jgi:transposase
MARIDVITGAERRRRWSDEQKRAVVAAAFAPGAVVSEVARRADLCTSLIYRWRREFGSASRGFAEVIVAPVGDGSGESRCCSAASPVETGRAAFADASGAPSIEVAFGGTSQVRIPASIPPDLAAAVIKALIGR